MKDDPIKITRVLSSSWFSDPSEQDEDSVAYDLYLYRLILQRFRIAGITVGLIFVLDGVIVSLVEPEISGITFWVRLVVGLMALVLGTATFFHSHLVFNKATLFLIIAGIVLDISIAAHASGGIDSPYSSALLVLMMGAILFFPLNLRETGLLILIVGVGLLGLVMADYPSLPQYSAIYGFVFAAAALVSLVVTWSTGNLRRREFLAQRALAREQKRSQGLLHNILPESIAEKLKSENSTIAERIPQATVLFADIVGFTPFSDKQSPEKVVEFLHKLFSLFDDLSKAYHLEKIKTIGDAYMVAGGVPDCQHDHAARVADFALAVTAEMKSFSLQGSESPRIRIGINSGPVVAGVIGKNKFAYDLWGDTVNMAARMESQGLPGEIQVSESTYLQLAGNYIFRSRGEINIKGKGLMPTWLLMGKQLPGQASGEASDT